MNETIKNIISESFVLKAFMEGFVNQNVFAEFVNVKLSEIQVSEKIYYYGMVENATTLTFEKEDYSIEPSERSRLFQELKDITDQDTLFQGLKITVL